MSRTVFGVVAKITASLLLVIGVVWLGLRVVRADVQSGWLSTANASVQKVIDLPPNQYPVSSNRDCTQMSYVTTDPATGYDTTASDCFVKTTRGFMQPYGSPILFNNSSRGIGMIGYQNGNYLLQPIPNQQLVLSLTSSSVLGNYAHFYTDVYSHLTTSYSPTLSVKSYAVNQGPDFQLRDKTNALININPNTIAYSSNGAWMLVDAYARGFLRINLATFGITSFGQSLSGASDYRDHYGVTAISDDGRFATIGSNEYSYFKIYDLSTCSGPTPDDYKQQQSCQFRDYWPSMASNLNAFRSLYSVRFINDDNVSVTAGYDWYPTSPSNFDAATFRLTAPGKSAHSLDYLAIGDSFASGQGEFTYKDGTDTSTNACHLSPLSYPFTIGTGLFNQYQSVACSGAKVKDITGQGVKNYNSDPGGAQATGESSTLYDADILSNFSPGYRTQIQFVQAYQPRVVTLSVGGNDIGFTNIITSCVSPFHLPANGETCYGTWDERARLMKTINDTYQKLHDTYQLVMQSDPGVKLYVIGYPQVAVQGSCADNVRLNSDEIKFSQQIIAELDSVVQRAADSAGARYVDVSDAFNGSRLCEAKSGDVAVNGLTAGNDGGFLGVKVVGNESFHPNVIGHRLLAESILKKTSNLTQPMPIATTATPPSMNDPLAQAPLLDLIPSGKALPAVVVADDSLLASVATRGTSTALAVDGGKDGLKPSSTFQVLGDSVTPIGTATSDANGNITSQITLPADMSPGYHTIHLTGLNMAGQTIDIYEIVYVAASTNDYDGDSVPNAADQCLIVPLSGHDVDSDGIDDACDPIIGDPPKYQYPVSVHLNPNTIYIVNP